MWFPVTSYIRRSNRALKDDLNPLITKDIQPPALLYFPPILGHLKRSLHQFWVPGSISRVPYQQSCTQPLKKTKQDVIDTLGIHSGCNLGSWSASLTEGDISRHAEGDRLRQWCGLGEEIEIVEGKNQLNRFVHLNCDLDKGREICDKCLKMLKQQ